MHDKQSVKQNGLLSLYLCVKVVVAIIHATVRVATQLFYFTAGYRHRKPQQILGIEAMNRAKKVLKSARPLRIIHRVKVRVRGKRE